MNTKNNILHILFIAFMVRFILLLINNYWFILPQGGGDAIVFEENAYLLSISGYDIDIWYYLTSGSRLFYLLGSFVYVIFGRQPFILGFIMVVLGVYIVKLVFKGALLLWQDYKIAKKAAWFAALFPVLILHSALFLREIPVNVFLVLAMISFIKYWKYKRKVQVIWLLIYTICATLLHTGSIFLLFGLLFFVFLYSKERGFSMRFGAFVIVITSIYILNTTGFGLSKIGGSFDSSVSLFLEKENYELKGDSAYPEWLMLKGGLNDFMILPLRYIAFLFTPLIPFLVRSFSHLVGLIDAFLYLYMFYFFYKKRAYIKQNDTAKGIFTMSLILVLVFSLGTSNVGTAIRHRAKIAPLFIIVFVGIHKNRLNLK